MAPSDAAIAARQLDAAEGVLRRRREVTRRWRRLLVESGIEVLDIPKDAADDTAAKLPVRASGHRGPDRVTLLARELWRAGVQSEGSYIPLHLRAPFQGFRAAPSLPATEEMQKRTILLPNYPTLGPADWERIASALRVFRVDSAP